MEFLPLEEIRRREDDVRGALERILATRAVVGQEGALQWRFLRACLDGLFAESTGEWDGLSSAQAAQLKFEVQEKLRAHYDRNDGGDGLAFALVHAGRLSTYRLAQPERYPRLAGYCLLARDPKRDASLSHQDDALKEYLERVVAAAAESEFSAYSALPDQDTSGLEHWLWSDGAYFADVRQRLRRRRADGWVLSNAFNPSTHRTASVDVRRLAADEGLVAVREYWYLRWWSVRTREYIYAYRAELRHHYALSRRGHCWRVLSRQRQRVVRGS